ncbi:hypothetical protein JOQ06_015292 [Pogonophryne albipinna]|uniref:ELKS/RAB6-interacting/CAST family member 2 n=1 Tax=Pogonophryne albipinna TaxID=1090488 RepID=A0AAD6FB91_9TELE|nr:hypothetical protein JOQ06_015292 [Pogonophryne albipinna]
MTIQALQDELRTQRDLNHLLQQEGGNRSDHFTTIELTEENFRRLQAEHDRQAKELFLLRKTLEEMELRIETQKQTLGARDESIKKLLEMLQSKGLPPGSGRVSEDEEQERARRIAEAEAQLGHLEVILDQKDKENIHLREELHRRNQLHQDPGKTKALQTIIEMKLSSLAEEMQQLVMATEVSKINSSISETAERGKTRLLPPVLCRKTLHLSPLLHSLCCVDADAEDTKIASLERNIRDLEDEIQMLKANGLLNTEDREEEIKQMEVYKNHSKFMKTKIDQLKQELSKKESELLALQTKLETLNNQNSDCKQHIEVLKESLTAKEQRAAILQTEVDALRLRLEEKESFLNKKTKQLQDLTEEKGTLAGEIRDMKDMLEVKERKINVLQKKIENLQEQLRDKDKQLGNLKDRVKSLQTDSSNTDTALATLEEALSEKERIIERLKDQREREDRERLDEVDSYRKENKDLKEKVNGLQIELTEKESSLIDLKDHASSLASSSLKKESKLKTLEIAIEQKKEECSKLETQLQKKAHEVDHQTGPRGNPEYVDRVKLLEKEVNYYKDEANKSQTEVERLLDILREVETEKNDKDKKIAELESPPSTAPRPAPRPGGRAPPDPLPSVSAAPQQIGGMVWDFLGNLTPRQGGKDQTKKGPNVKLGPQGDKKGLGQDPRKDGSMDHLKLEELMNTLERTRQELDSTKQRLSSTQQSLQERDGNLTNMRQERRKQLEEILEMKQQALLAAISEKDANIALLELSTSNKKKTQDEVLSLKRERDKLMHQLKQHTNNIIPTLLTTPSLSLPTLSLPMLSLSPSLSTPTLPTLPMLRTLPTLPTLPTLLTLLMPSRLHIPTPCIRNTRRPPNSTHTHSRHNPNTLTLSSTPISTPSSTPISTHSSTPSSSTPHHLLSTNSTHDPHSPNTLTNSTLPSTHTDIPLPSTHTALPNKDPTPNIHIPSTPSTRITANIHVTHRPIIVEGRPEDPHMLVTALPRTRGHLTCLSPADHYTSSGQQRPLHPPSRDLMTACQSPVFVPHPPPCDGSRSWSSCCLFLLPTDPSGWLPHLTLSWFLDPHCPADPPGDI